MSNELLLQAEAVEVAQDMVVNYRRLINEARREKERLGAMIKGS